MLVRQHWEGLLNALALQETKIAEDMQGRG